MLRLGVISDVHGRDLEQALNDFNVEKVDGVLFNGDVFEAGNISIDILNLSKVLSCSDKPAYFLPGSHENMFEYKMLMKAAVEKAEGQVFDLLDNKVVDFNGFKIIGLPGTTWYPGSNQSPLIINDQSFTEFSDNLNSVDPSKTIVMCHLPAYELGDTAYFALTDYGLIPGFAALNQLGEKAFDLLKPSHALCEFSELLTHKLQEKKPLAFLSGHIHENNAFQSPGKDIVSLGPVKQGEVVKSLAFTQGPYVEDPLQSIYEQSTPAFNQNGLELNSPWSKAIGILTVKDEGASYKIRIVK